MVFNGLPVVVQFWIEQILDLAVEILGQFEREFDGGIVTVALNGLIVWRASRPLMSRLPCVLLGQQAPDPRAVTPTRRSTPIQNAMERGSFTYSEPNGLTLNDRLEGFGFR